MMFKENVSDFVAESCKTVMFNAELLLFILPLLSPVPNLTDFDSLLLDSLFPKKHEKSLKYLDCGEAVIAYIRPLLFSDTDLNVICFHWFWANMVELSSGLVEGKTMLQCFLIVKKNVIPKLVFV